MTSTRLRNFHFGENNCEHGHDLFVDNLHRSEKQCMSGESRADPSEHLILSVGKADKTEFVLCPREC